MHEKQANTVLVGKLLHTTNNFIVIGIAVIVGTDLTDFLQSVNDDQPCVGMLTDKLFKLLIKSCAELLCIYCEVQTVRSLHTEHSGHTFLQSLVIVLQGKV